MKLHLFVLLCISIVTSQTNLSKYKRDSNSQFLPLEEYERRFRPTLPSPSLKASSESPKITVGESNQTRSPCDSYIAPQRDFKDLKRRISETKCLEYMWDLKVRDEKHTLDVECYEAKQRQYEKEHPSERKINRHAVFRGRETLPGEFSHMGAIGWLGIGGSWIFKCGSSLISHNFMLTAAHCSSASPRDTTVIDIVPKIVRLGDKNIMDRGIFLLDQRDINISRIIVHPEYKSPYHYYDIALIELQDKVIFNKQVQPGCLWHKYSLSDLGSQGTVTGWGVVESNRDEYHPELLAAKIDFIDTERCNNYLNRYYNRNFNGVADHQLCAAKLTGGVDACQGDSGGPLQVEIPIPVYSQGKMHYLVGVTSFGIRCGLENTPGVYTRISAFIDWIESIVWPNDTNTF